jgi:hypothetical protein
MIKRIAVACLFCYIPLCRVVAQDAIERELGVTVNPPPGWTIVDREEIQEERAIAALVPIENDSSGLALIAVYLVTNEWRTNEEPLTMFGVDSQLEVAQVDSSLSRTDGTPLIVWMTSQEQGDDGAPVTSVTALRVIKSGWLQVVFSASEGNRVTMREVLTKLLAEYLVVSPSMDLLFREIAGASSGVKPTRPKLSWYSLMMSSALWLWSGTGCAGRRAYSFRLMVVARPGGRRRT